MFLGFSFAIRRVYRLFSIDPGYLSFQLLFLLDHCTAFADKDHNHQNQNGKCDQIQPAKAQTGMFQNICHIHFRLPFVTLPPEPGGRGFEFCYTCAVSEV